MSEPPPSLLLRADGGRGRGAGHLARSLALAQAWIDARGTAELATEAAPEPWPERFEAAGCRVVTPAEATAGPDWSAVDGYELPTPTAAPGGSRVLRVDDHDGARTAGAGADLVVDQNLGTGPTLYPDAAALLLGPRYALLRRELAMSPPNELIGPVRRVVLILGGAPADEVVDAGRRVAADPRLGGLDVRVLDGSDDAVAAMRAADILLAAAGTVSWEACCLGVPMVLVAVAPNQEPVAAHLSSRGAAMSVALDPAQMVEAVLGLARDADARAQLAGMARSLVDGRGARRVVTRMRGEMLRLRSAVAGDAEMVFRVNNDPLTRAASFTTEPLVWERHVSWYAARLADPRAATYIAEDRGGVDVGLVRFDASDDGGTAEVGVVVVPEQRGSGWGAALVDAGCRAWTAERGDVLVEARIKAGNKASIQAFLDADFDPMPSSDPEVLRYARSSHVERGRADHT